MLTSSKIKTVAGYWNYDSSEFDRVAALSADDDELEATWKQAYSLEEYTADSQFKGYEELDSRLNAVLNVAPRVAAVQQEEEETLLLLVVSTTVISLLSLLSVRR